MKAAFIGLLILSISACVASKDETTAILEAQGYSNISVYDRHPLIECRDFQATSLSGSAVSGRVCRNTWIGHVVALDTP